MPSNGLCVVPLTLVGNGRFAASSTVGAMSVTWVNCGRIPPLSRIRAGHWITMPLVVPP